MTEHHDWGRIIQRGQVMAVDNARADARLGPEDVMWALFQDACRVSKTYSGPPRLGYPSRSSMPEAPGEQSAWAKVMDYLRGEVDELPVSDRAVVRPSAEEITRSEAVLLLWHRFALRKKGKRVMLRKSVYALGCGAPYRAIRERTGIARASLYRAKDDAMHDMWTGLKEIANMP